MTINVTVNKKILETIIHETFLNFGFLSSSSLLDSLKLLGFFYATNAGISINIEDLKTPDLKKRYIQTANQEILKISQEWSEGIISDQERFQSIIDSWNIATESLKNRIVEYYQDFDPANNLYIMAFSGARGNMSQVRQLVGMRGLMSDQEGKIIDLPIQANFREGLSSIDYIISSYGARKGIVDTALKTADSGYLTRRLIYLAQDLIIREIDCKTKKGIIIVLKKNSSIKNLIGRELLLAKKGSFPFSLISNFSKKEQKTNILNSQFIEDLKAISPTILTIRSALTCKSTGSICQKCYGWDLAQQKLISLGENVGIIAAQSIGEPGTQLTMRTFHTGGIFTSENLKQLVAPFSGKIIIPTSLKALSYRTNHGIKVLKLQQEINLKLINWKGFETIIFIEIGSYLYIPKTTFIYKGQLISEVLNQSTVSSERKLKPIYTRIAGKVLCNDLIPCFRRTRKGKTRRILLKQGLLWIAAGKIFSLPFEAEYLFSTALKKEKAIARLKIITPKKGIIFLTMSTISIITKQEKIVLDLSNLINIFKNCSTKIIPLVRNYQYVDNYTVLAFVYIFPSFSAGKIMSIEKKQSKFKNIFFVISESDTWNLYGPINSFKNNKITKNNDNILPIQRNYSLLNFFISLNSENQEKQLKKKDQLSEIINLNKKTFFNIISPTSFNDSILKIKHSGLNLYNDRYFRLFQHLDAICLPTSTILNSIQNDLVLEKKLFAILVNYTQQTDDIVQGLPKIEELIEARKPKLQACLSKYPGIVLNRFSSKFVFSNINTSLLLSNNKLQCFVPKIFSKKKKVKKDKTEEKQILIVAQSLKKKKNFLLYQNTFFEVKYFSSSFKYDSYCFKSQKDGKKLELSKKKNKWEKKILPNELFKSLSDFFSKQMKKEVSSFQKKDSSHCFVYEVKNDLDEDNSNIITRTNLNNLDEENYTEIEEENLNSFNEDSSNYLEEEKSNNFSKTLLNDLDEENFNDEEKNNFNKDYIFELNEKVSIYLKNIGIPLTNYSFSPTSKILLKKGDFVDIGEPISDGIIDSHELLNILFSYHCELDGIIEGTLKSLNKFQLILANSIQSIYQAQGVTISSKHIEIIVRQMTSKVVIKTTGDTPFLPGELVSVSFILEIYETFKINPSYKTPLFEPKLLSATNSSLNKDGFLSAAGFQETRKILTKAAIEGTSDWLRGLKESIISGRIIPAGSAFLNYKNYLDNLFFFKE
jgi:hypothetical protein